MAFYNKPKNIPTGRGLIFGEDDATFSTPLFSVDLVLSETHRVEIEATSIPVEAGGDITDNLKVRPQEFSCEVLITSATMDARSSFQSVYNDKSGGMSSISEARKSEWRQKVSDAFLTLSRLARGEGPEGARLFTVATTVKIYTSMALVSVDLPREGTTEESAKITVKFKEIRIAKSTSAPVKNVAGMVATASPQGARSQAAIQAQPTANGGQGTTKPVGQSWLSFGTEKKDPLSAMGGSMKTLFGIGG